MADTHPGSASPVQMAQAVAQPAYRSEIVADLGQFLQRCEHLAQTTSLPFQRRAWLSAWYATLGRSAGRQPLLLALRDKHSGADLALLPLVQRRQSGLRLVEFADADVTDYNAPLLAPHWHQGAAPAVAAQQLWLATREALRGHDLLLLDKQLAQLLDQTPGDANPLVLALRLQASDHFGNAFSAPEGWEAWRRSLDKTVRKEIERCWRVFERSPTARFEQAQTVDQALALFAELDAQQAARARQLGQHYQLDQPAYQAFYRQLITEGHASGQVLLTALRDGDAVVAALLSVASSQRMVALRQSIGGAAWKAMSPGRLLDDGTARHLHAHGLTQFDFGIGDYRHKAVLKMAPIALRCGCVALSWRGWPGVAAWHARRWLKARPGLRALWLGRIKPLLQR